MTTLTIKLPEELKARLEAEARLSGKSVSAVVRDSLERRLRAKRHAGTSLYERTKDLYGIGESGIPDLATNPKYMEGFGAWRE